MFEFAPQEKSLLKKLDTPRKIQHFINSIPINFEKNGDTCFSPRMVLQEWKAHCVEGAMLAAAALRLQGFPPLIVDLETTKGDYDHVIAVFQQKGHWGAISKTNHGVLRYRDPIYKSIRELVMSYFHEYFDSKGKKTLRTYTLPVNLSQFDKKGWMTSEQEVWYVPDYLTTVKHVPILSRAQIAILKKPDQIEQKVGRLVEWRKG